MRIFNPLTLFRSDIQIRPIVYLYEDKSGRMLPLQFLQHIPQRSGDNIFVNISNIIFNFIKKIC